MIDEKNPQEAKIRKGLGPKRDATSLQVLRDIVIPAGTLLRSAGDNKFSAEIGVGLITVHGVFSIDTTKEHGDLGAVLKRVTAA